MAGDDEELDDLLNAIEQGAGNVKVNKETNLFQKCLMQTQKTPAIYEYFNMNHLCDRKPRRGKWRIWGLMKKGRHPNIKVLFCVALLTNAIVIVLSI